MASLWILVSCIFFAAMTAVIKLTSVKISLFEIVFYRSVINLFIMGSLIIIKKQSFKTPNFKGHFVRSTVGMIAMFMGFYALIQLPIATATSLTYTNPIFQTIIAFFQNRRKISIALIASVLLGFMGCLILLNPKLSGLNHVAIMIGIMAGLFTALAYFNVNKLIRAGESNLLVVFYFSLICSVFSLIGIMLGDGFSALELQDMLMILLIGIFGSVGQVTLTQAYGHGNPVVVGTLSYSQIIFAAILGYLIFSETISLYSVLGIILILMAGMVSLLNSRKAKS